MSPPVLLCLSPAFDERSQELRRNLYTAATDKVIIVEEGRKRGSTVLTKDPPECIDMIKDEHSLRSYSLDALRKLAQKVGLDLSKISREKAIQRLLPLLHGEQHGLAR